MSADPQQHDPVTYVYGITSSGVALPGHLPRIPGGGPVRPVDTGQLRAVVCGLDRRALDALQALGTAALDALTTTAHGHDTTLSTLVRDRSVVPVRLGTVLPGDAAVRHLLAQHADELQAELDQQEGHAEWAVKAHPSQPTTHHEPAPVTGSPGRDYLAQRRAVLRGRRDTRAHQPTADTIHHRLATDVAKAYLVASTPVLHGVYLLHRDRTEHFAATITDLQRRYPQWRIEPSGPWPPYHFTSVRIGGTDGVSP